MVTVSVSITLRDMVQKTFKERGLPYVSQLALENSRALKALVQWNHEHAIRFFRSSFLTNHHTPLRSDARTKAQQANVLITIMIYRCSSRC